MLECRVRKGPALSLEYGTHHMTSPWPKGPDHLGDRIARAREYCAALPSYILLSPGSHYSTVFGEVDEFKHWNHWVRLARLLTPTIHCLVNLYGKDWMLYAGMQGQHFKNRCLGELAAAIAYAKAVITCDSGTAHFAALFGVPVIIVSGLKQPHFPNDRLPVGPHSLIYGVVRETINEVRAEHVILRLQELNIIPPILAPDAVL